MSYVSQTEVDIDATVTLAEPGEQLQWSGALISERLFLGSRPGVRSRP
jgi:hypothetical protein